MPQSAERLVYRVRDLARLLGCSELAARRMTERGAVPSRRLGRRVVILADELEAYLQSLPSYRPLGGHGGDAA